MNSILHLCCVLLCTLITSISYATPSGDYTDFLPKYRSQNKNFILTKIVYTTDKMIVHFQYVASKDNESVRFGGATSPNPWQLYAASRGTTGSTKNASIQNIVINGVLKAAKIMDNNEAQFVAKKGEVIAGEAHFSKLDKTIRTINFAGGDIADCMDILIKEESNDLLGNEEQMEGSINRFYNMISHFGVNVIKPPKNTTVVEDKKLATLELGKKDPAPTQKTTTNTTPTEEPLKYMPKELSSVKDMECNSRVILKNVYFSDNSSEYQGRVEALKTIQIIVDYMNLYPQSVIILHGHTDIFGNSANNLKLSEDRVLAVKRTIVQSGISSDRITTVSHGSNQPLPDFVNGGGKNRRVEVEVVCKK